MGSQEKRRQQSNKMCQSVLEWFILASFSWAAVAPPNLILASVRQRQDMIFIDQLRCVPKARKIFE